MSSRADAAIAKVQSNLNAFKEKIELRGAKKFGTLPQRIRWVIITMSEAAVFLVIGLLRMFSTMGLKAYVLYPFLFYGIILVALRYAFLWLLKLLVKIAIVPVDIINVILVFFDVAVNLAITAIDEILSVVNIIISVIKALDPHIHVHSVQLIHWIHIDLITVAEFKRVVGTLISTCTKYQSFGSIALFLTRLGLHEYTCPVVRAVYPVEWLYHVSEAVLGFSYYGSAAPFPRVPDDNCQASGYNSGYDDVCCALGIGYLFLEFFLPVVLLYIALRALWTFLYKAGSLAVYTFEVGLEITHNTIVHAIDALVEG